LHVNKFFLFETPVLQPCEIGAIKQKEGKMYWEKRLIVDVQFQVNDIHDRPSDFHWKEKDTFVTYKLTDAHNQLVLKVADFRKSAIQAYEEVYRNHRVTPEIIVQKINGPAVVKFPCGSGAHESPRGGIAREIYRFLGYIELREVQEDQKISGILTHVAHGRWIIGGEALKLTPNLVKRRRLFGKKTPHSAITVIASADYPTIIEQTPCQGRVTRPPVLFINEKLRLVDLPEHGVTQAVIQEFVENGIVPGT